MQVGKLEEIKAHGYVLTPGRYVGAADVEDDDVPFAERFAVLQSERWKNNSSWPNELSATIRKRIARVVFDG